MHDYDDVLPWRQKHQQAFESHRSVATLKGRRNKDNNNGDDDGYDDDDDDDDDEDDDDDVQQKLRGEGGSH